MCFSAPRSCRSSRRHNAHTAAAPRRRTPPPSTPEAASPHRHRRVHALHVALVDEDLPRPRTQRLDLALLQVLAALQLLDLAVEIAHRIVGMAPERRPGTRGASQLEWGVEPRLRLRLRSLMIRGPRLYVCVAVPHRAPLSIPHVAAREPRAGSGGCCGAGAGRRRPTRRCSQRASSKASRRRSIGLAI